MNGPPSAACTIAWEMHFELCMSIPGIFKTECFKLMVTFRERTVTYLHMAPQITRRVLGTVDTNE